MARGWQQDLSPSGDTWFVYETEGTVEAIAPPGVALRAGGGGDSPGWRHGLWDMTIDRFSVPFQSAPDEEARLTTTQVLEQLPVQDHATVRRILEDQLAIARQLGVATQQRLCRAGDDPGSRSERWLAEELRAAFGVRVGSLDLVHGSASYVEAVKRDRDTPENLSVRHALARVLSVIRQRVDRRLHHHVPVPPARRASQQPRSGKSSETGEFIPVV